MSAAVVPADAAKLGPRKFAGPSPRLLLISQLVFNVGSFAVIPFPAVSMRDDFGKGALAMGMVLGVRTFAQQGMFLPCSPQASRPSPFWPPGQRPRMRPCCSRA